MRRMFPVALNFVAASLVFGPGSQAQHVGPVSGSGAAVHAAAPPSFQAPAHTSNPPQGSFFQHPTSHNPSLQGGRSARPDRWPGAAQTHHPDDGRNGGGSGRYPYIYGSYPPPVPFGYGLPLAYAPFGGEQNDLYEGGTQSSAPQSAAQSDQPEGEYGPPPARPDYGAQSGAELAANGAPAFRPNYQGQPGSPGQLDPVRVRPQPTTTLIFKDGRRSVQVQNYALTSTTLYALDGESRREIPLSLLNLPATVETNRAVGVDFALPTSR